jgi:starvation-inducible DNA-binding protein
MAFEIKITHDAGQPAYPATPTPLGRQPLTPMDPMAATDRMKTLLGVGGKQMPFGMTQAERQAELEKLTARLSAGNTATEESEPSDLVSELKDLLGDVVVFKFLAHGFHWNVTGINFQQFHSFFGDIYADADDSIDPIAENIRKVNATAPFLLSDYIEEYPEEYNTTSTDPIELSKVLYMANQDVQESLQCAYDCAVKYNEQGIANFLAERLDQHAKWQWQLRSIIGNEFADASQSATED